MKLKENVGGKDERNEKKVSMYLYISIDSKRDRNRKKSKLNHLNGLTKFLQMVEKLLSMFAFQFRARDHQRKCDSVL